MLDFPAFLKPHDGGGWKNVSKVDSPEELFAAYGESGDLCMTLQAGVKFQEYFRCYVVDRKHVHIMRYDPGAPHHLRYVPGNPPALAELHKRMVADALTLCRALGYDLNTVEFAVEDGVPYAIDFMNPGARCGAGIRRPGEFPMGGRSRCARWPWRERLAPPRNAGMRWARSLREVTNERAQASQPDHRNRGRVSNRRSRNARSEIAHQRGDHPEGQDAAGAKWSSRRCISRWSRSAPEFARNIQEAKAEIRDIRRQIVNLARANGLRLAAGGTHPFAHWANQEIYPDDRYRIIVEDMKMVARANLIFGLHVHIGVEDRETAIQIMNGARYFLPHILALSSQFAVLDGHG